MKIAFDVKLKKPACVLLQAVYGCSEARSRVYEFPVHTWLLAPTPDMAVYECTEEQFDKLVEIVTKAHPTV